MDKEMEVKTLQEAFAKLSVEEQARCMRCARYAEIVFAAAEARDVYVGTARAEKELITENQELIKYAALYHSVGKVLQSGIEEGYEDRSADFFAKVHSQSLERKLKASERKMICEAIKEQNEAMDGTGHPLGKSKESISYLGRILALVIELDRLSMEIVSKSPFEDALIRIKKESSTKFDSEFYKAMKASKNKMIKIFEEDAKYSNLVAVAKPFIKRKPNRPMELVYRAICHTGKDLFAKEAQMRFKGSKENSCTYDEVKHIIRKHELLNQMCEYFLYEICDAYREFQSVNIQCEWIGIELPSVWLNQKNLWSTMERILIQEEVPASAIRLIVSAENLKKPVKKLSENIRECHEHGLEFVLSGASKEYLESGIISYEDYPFAAIRCTLECLMSHTLPEAELFHAWEAKGVEILADEVDNNSIYEAVYENGIDGYTGLYAGIYEKEADIMDHAVKFYYTKE